MNAFLKSLCLATYALALTAPFVTLPMDLGPWVQRLAVVLIAIHVLELVVAQKYLKLYKGPFIDSLVLSLMYGLLHWLPLAKASQRSAQG